MPPPKPFIPAFLPPATIPSSTGTALPASRPCAAPRYTPPTCKVDEPAPAPRRLRPKRKASAFENTLDDLTMKRLGRGSMYYGERPAEAESPDMPADDLLLKADPVLVMGGTGRTGQWVALGLVNQGFNVRVLARSFAAAERLFGPSGSNLDVMPGDLSCADDVAAAIDGAVAVVVASGAPWWWPGGYDAVDVQGVRNLLEACRGAPSVRRIVLISTANGDSPRGRAKREAEALVRESGLPYVILRAAPLSDAEGGLCHIELTPGEEIAGKRGELSRVDLAQSVCQALVYDRSISELKEEDPEGEFDFPSCVVTVRNTKEPYEPDKRFWKTQFNKISDAYREKTNAEEEDAVE